MLTPFFLSVFQCTCLTAWILGLWAGLLNLPEDKQHHSKATNKASTPPSGVQCRTHTLFPVLLISQNKKSRAGMRELWGFGTKWRWKKPRAGLWYWKVSWAQDALIAHLLLCHVGRSRSTSVSAYMFVCLLYTLYKPSVFQLVDVTTCFNVKIKRYSKEYVNSYWRRLLIHRLIGFKEVLWGIMIFFFFAHLFIMHNGPYQTRAKHKSHAEGRNVAIFA